MYLLNGFIFPFTTPLWLTFTTFFFQKVQYLFKGAVFKLLFSDQLLCGGILVIFAGPAFHIEMIFLQ